jgi:hypothetical protein
MYTLRKPLLPYVIIIVLSFGFNYSKAADFEIWTFVGGQTKIRNMNFSFHSANFFRKGGDYFLNHTQLSLDFLSKKNVSFGIGYKQEYVDFISHWRAEYRPMLHLYYNKSFRNISFRDRSRWEFRFIEGNLIHRYRNQMQLTITKFDKITPYFSTEFSFYLNKLRYTRQRTILGAEIPINNIKLNLFLGHQINEDFPDIWINKIMMGTGLRYSF